MARAGLADTISPEAAEPLYQQVKRLVVEGIRNGDFGGARVPSEAYLVERLNVSRMTVHRALRELKAEGVIVRVPGRGTFVSPEKPRTTLLETQDIAEEIRGRGSLWTCRIVALAEVEAGKEIASALGLRPGDTVYHSAIVHEENGEPVQFEERWVNPAVAPGYLDQDFTRRTSYRFLMDSAPLSEVEHVLHAVRPDRRMQEYLRIAPDEPCLLLARRTWSGRRAATRSILVFPGERYSLGGRYRVMGEAEQPALSSIQTGEVFGARRGRARRRAAKRR
ncbi:MAG TPA: histidine utilization repressor [Bauldia sp.]|nr:histidine utilization repressor [Bauldia sp.]